MINHGNHILIVSVFYTAAVSINCLENVANLAYFVTLTF